MMIKKVTMVSGVLMALILPKKVLRLGLEMARSLSRTNPSFTRTQNTLLLNTKNSNSKNLQHLKIQIPHIWHVSSRTIIMPKKKLTKKEFRRVQPAKMRCWQAFSPQTCTPESSIILWVLSEAKQNRKFLRRYLLIMWQTR
jgi:hypothetical protein